MGFKIHTKIALALTVIILALGLVGWTKAPDGSVTLSKDEVEQIGNDIGTMRYQMQTLVEEYQKLQKKYEQERDKKCI